MRENGGRRENTGKVENPDALKHSAGPVDPRAMAERLLAPLPRRRAHSLAVGVEAERVAAVADPETRSDLVVAAYLHDIGYAPTVVETGAHQLDGARLLRRERLCDRVCRLVAHHSGAIHEARKRQLEADLVHEFPPPDQNTLALLTYCDMSTGPTGDPVSVEDRLTDIFSRYGAGHVVSRAMRAAEPGIRAAVSMVRQRLKRAGLPYR